MSLSWLFLGYGTLLHRSSIVVYRANLSPLKKMEWLSFGFGKVITAAITLQYREVLKTEWHTRITMLEKPMAG